jgi:hypothetical protein
VIFNSVYILQAVFDGVARFLEFIVRYIFKQICSLLFDKYLYFHLITDLRAVSLKILMAFKIDH